MSDYLYSDFELHEQPNGSVHIHSSEPYGEVAVIKPADRPKVALALLGGITDELALRVNEAILDVLNDRFTGGPTLHVINAVFGISEP